MHQAANGQPIKLHAPFRQTHHVNFSRAQLALRFPKHLKHPHHRHKTGLAMSKKHRYRWRRHKPTSVFPFRKPSSHPTSIWRPGLEDAQSFLGQNGRNKIRKVVYEGAVFSLGVMDSLWFVVELMGRTKANYLSKFWIWDRHTVWKIKFKFLKQEKWTFLQHFLDSAKAFVRMERTEQWKHQTLIPFGSAEGT